MCLCIHQTERRGNNHYSCMYASNYRMPYWQLQVLPWVRTEQCVFICRHAKINKLGCILLFQASLQRSSSHLRSSGWHSHLRTWLMHRVCKLKTQNPGHFHVARESALLEHIIFLHFCRVFADIIKLCLGYSLVSTAWELLKLRVILTANFYDLFNGSTEGLNIFFSWFQSF